MTDSDIMEMAIVKFKVLSNQINKFRFGHFNLPLTNKYTATVVISSEKIKEIVIEYKELGATKVIRPE